MLGALLILSFAIFLAFFEPVLAIKKSFNKENTKYDAEIKKLWTIAKDSMNSRKTLRAEKALLTILKLFMLRHKILTKPSNVLKSHNLLIITQCHYTTWD